MARRSVLLAALGAAAAVAALVIVAAGESSSSPPPITEAASSVLGGPASTTMATGGSAADSDTGDDVSSAATPRVAVDDQRSSGPTLRLIEATTRQPLPGAEVFVGSEELMRGAPNDPRPWIDRVVSSGDASIADELGTIALAPIDNGVVVVARARGLFGVGWFDRRTPPIAELALATDHTLRVRVVDAGGSPQPGVRVVLCADLPRRLERLATAVTGEDGNAVFTHVQLERRKLPSRKEELQARVEQTRDALARLESTLRVPDQSSDQRQALGHQQQAIAAELRAAQQQLRELQRAERERGPVAGGELLPDAGFVVLAEVPALQPPMLRFAAAAIPERPIELRIGATGSLVVRLLGPQGLPLRSPCKIVVSSSADTPLPAAVTGEQADSARRILRQSADKPSGSGEVRLAPIGAGLRLEVRVEFADDDFDFARADVAGPVAGEECVVELNVPDWWTVVSGRFVAAGGTPLPALRTELFVAGADGRIEGEPVVAGDDGRFELPVRLRRPAPPYTLEVQATQGGQRLGALLPMPALQVGTRHDLGDVQLADLPVLAFGVVRDDRGEPIVGANVSLQVLRPGGGGKAIWRDETFVRAATDEAGRYRLFGVARANVLRLRARARGHAAEEGAEIVFGAERDMILDRLGGLSGSGLLPEWMPREAVRLRLLIGQQRVQDQPLRVRSDGRFTFDLAALRAGRYTALLELRGLQRPLLRTDGIVVPHGEVVTDPRLQDVDLRAVLFRYSISAVDQNGAPVHGGNAPLVARLTDAEGQVGAVGFPWRGDRVEFIATDPIVDVVALATGSRPVRAVVHPGDNRLTLRRLHAVEVVLPGLRELVGAERSVRISLVFTGDTGLPMTDFSALDQWTGDVRQYQRASLGKSGGAWLGDRGDRVQVPLMLNGDYRIIARIGEPGLAAQVAVELDTMPVVVDGAAPPRLVVTTPIERVQAAIADLLRQKAAAPAVRQR